MPAWAATTPPRPTLHPRPARAPRACAAHTRGAPPRPPLPWAAPCGWWLAARAQAPMRGAPGGPRPLWQRVQGERAAWPAGRRHRGATRRRWLGAPASLARAPPPRPASAPLPPRPRPRARAGYGAGPASTDGCGRPRP
eukprot:scaffold22372_cov69-Phaeocystis_antarctica.AAC.3